MCWTVGQDKVLTTKCMEISIYFSCPWMALVANNESTATWLCIRYRIQKKMFAWPSHNKERLGIVGLQMERMN